MRRAFGRLAVALACLASPAVHAQAPSAEDITPATRQALSRMQEQWLQWMSAFYQNNSAKADNIVSGLLGTAQQLGMRRLPDLCLGAGVRAVQSAREGNLPRAHWALAAAERLDPGRPETAFAEATVARVEGSYLRAAVRHVAGWLRLFGSPALRRMWLHGASSFAGYALLLAAGLYLAVQMATKGGALLHDLERGLARRMPRPLAWLLTLLVVTWPIALPSGPLWLALYWSVLLWGYGRPRERALLVVLWLLAAVLPAVAALGQRELVVDLLPASRVLDQVAQRRLVGTLFVDLGTLRAALPDSAAVRQLQADVNRILGQWDIARALYQQVLQVEPQNTKAMIDIGAYHFRRGEFARAVEFFQRVATADPRSAAAYYDLSLAYSEAYQFDESRQALAQARQVDDGQVTAWIEAADPERVITFDGGVQRRDEIRAQLDASPAAAQIPPPGPLASLTPLAAVAAAAAIALLLQLARHNGALSEPSPDLTVEGGAAARWLRALLAGVPESEAGRPLAAFGAVLAPAALLLLPWAGKFGMRLPWGYEPGRGLEWTAAVAGLLLFFGLRLWREVRVHLRAPRTE